MHQRGTNTVVVKRVWRTSSWLFLVFLSPPPPLLNSDPLSVFQRRPEGVQWAGESYVPVAGEVWELPQPVRGVEGVVPHPRSSGRNQQSRRMLLSWVPRAASLAAPAAPAEPRLVDGWLLPDSELGRGDRPRSPGARQGAGCCLWPEQGWRWQVQACGSLLYCTCCASGEYKQLSDINRDNPGGGPGPNTCFFFFLLLVELGCFERQFAAQAGGGGEGCCCLLRLRRSPEHARRGSELEPRRCQALRLLSKVAGSCSTLKFSDKQTAQCLTWETLTSLCGLRQSVEG